MVFSKQNAGKWVASKDGKVVAATRSLDVLLKKVDARRDRESLRFDLVPPPSFFAGSLLSWSSPT